MSNQNQLYEVCKSGTLPELQELQELLRNNTININAKDNDGKTALHYACLNGHLECAILLLKNQIMKLN